MKKVLILASLIVCQFVVAQSKTKKKTTSKTVLDKLKTVAKTLPASLPKVATALSEGDISAGLKEALNVGTDITVKQLSATDGYLGDALMRILLPAEAQSKVAALKSVIGQDNYNKFLKTYEDDVIKSLNRAAEDAATTAAPIVKNAITGMTIYDAKNILIGQDTAATNYLRGKTFNGLIEAYTPKINESLDKPFIMSKSTNALYGDFVGAYNKMFENSVTSTLISGYNMFASNKVEKMPNTTLGEYATRRALSGLFIKVKDQEKIIRTDLNARTTDILKKVFDKKNWPL